MTDPELAGRTGRVDRVAADIAVIGDGPAGTSLAASLTEATEFDVVLIGPDDAWSPTYSAWADEIELNPLAPPDVWRHRVDSIDVRARMTRTLSRPYGVIDNDRLRAHLRRDVRHHRGVIGSHRDVDASLVFDATGWPSRLDAGVDAARPQGGPDWQIAYGVVLESAPAGPLGRPMLMDFSDPYGATGASDGLGVSTFAYALPVDSGWLVEETVLVGPDIEPRELQERLAARLGTSPDELHERAVETEEVRIPMGAPMSSPGHPVAFGAGAGLIHPATGYSVAASLSAAVRVGDALSDASHTLTSDDLERRAFEALWPAGMRRTRRFHEYGLDVLTGLDDEMIRTFFDVFFSLDERDQGAYLSVDSSPADIARVMTRMFARSPWSLRRRLAGGDPRSLVRVLRP
ncbi:MAG: lycopene cyclase family protein [Ilumatobacter sp.]